MRLLLLTHNPAGVGADYIRAVSLGREFAGAGHAVVLIATAPGLRALRPQGASGGLRELWFRDPSPARLRRSGLSPLEVLRRTRYLARERFDVLIAFGHRPAVSFPALQARRRTGAVYVGDWADLWGPGGIADERTPALRFVMGKLDGWLEKRARMQADGLTVVSEHLVRLARSWGIPQRRIHRTMAGADVVRIFPQPMQDLRRHHGIDLEAHILLYSGLSQYDRAQVVPVLAALAPLDPKARLLVVGDSSKPWKVELLKHSLEDRLIHFPHVPHDQLGGVLACADVMLLPFPDRGLNQARFPNRLGDYLAAGRPVVTNPTGEAERLVRQSGAGLLADPTAEAMARAVLKLFDDRDLAIHLGRRGRQYAEQVLAWPILAGQMLQFLGTLAARGFSGRSLDPGAGVESQTGTEPGGRS
jgi:glycosyltransferase involved in cell wall biosynthesis